MNAIYVMWLRELKKYVRSKSRIVGSLAQPLLYLLSFGYGLGAVYAKAGGGNYIEFLAPGIVGMSILFTSMFSGVNVIWDRQFGFLKETLVAPVPRLMVMFGRVLGSATVATIQGSIVIAATILVGFRPYSWPLLVPALVVMLLTAIVFTSLGTIIGSALRDMQGFQLIMNFLIMPMFFLSGALFPLTNVPLALKVLASVDPLSYGVDALRGLLINQSHFGLPLDFAVILGVIVAFLAAGSYFFSKIEA